MLKVVLLAVLLSVSTAYKNGVRLPMGPDMWQVKTICGPGHLRPLHKAPASQLPILTSADAGPYTLTVENVKNNPNFKYGPKTTLRVTLRANRGQFFKGFFITADVQDASMATKGVYSPAPGTNAQATEYCAKGIGHRESSNKQSVTIQWTAPQNFTHGKMQFVATVVKDFSTFYTGIKSEFVEANPNAPTETKFNEAQMKNGPMGGLLRNLGSGNMQGGINGLLNNLSSEMMKNMMNNLPRPGGQGGQGGQTNMGGRPGGPMNMGAMPGGLNLASMFRQQG